MKKLHSLKDFSVDGERVLVRTDFNVPLTKDGKILDNTRIKAALPTLKALLEKNSILILMSHLGRPEGVRAPEFSLKPVVEELSRLLHKPVFLAPDCVGEAVNGLVKKLKPGQILMLENLRFHEAEENPEKDPQFAKQLAGLGNYYIDDAFGCAHRAHASIVEVPKLLPGKSAPGFLMEKEIQFLGTALKNPKRPFLALIGGAKVSSKIGILKTLLEKVDVLAIGGGMAFTFLKAQGFLVGNSLVEEAFIEEAKALLVACQKANITLLLPVDAVIARSMENSESKTVLLESGIPEGYMGLDIGPETTRMFQKAIQQAETILWNGPMGVFEIPCFAKGTEAIASAFAESKGVTVAGGGETVAALSKVPDQERISHISTGGGATLEFVEHGSLPGIESLVLG